MASTEPEPVPQLPSAREVKATVEAVERGLEYLRGLAVALERVERSPAVAGAGASESASA